MVPCQYLNHLKSFIMSVGLACIAHETVKDGISFLLPLPTFLLILLDFFQFSLGCRKLFLWLLLQFFNFLPKRSWLLSLFLKFFFKIFLSCRPCSVRTGGLQANILQKLATMAENFRNNICRACWYLSIFIRLQHLLHLGLHEQVRNQMHFSYTFSSNKEGAYWIKEQ